MILIYFNFFNFLLIIPTKKIDFYIISCVYSNIIIIMSNTMDNLMDVCHFGKYYDPASSHYGPGRVVKCDRCGKTNLKVCFGYQKLDLCLTCVDVLLEQETPRDTPDPEIALTFMEQDQFRPKYATLMQQAQFRPSRPPALTRMEQDQFR